jgi:tetratricopeptide (TPR) repeat protein
LQQALDIDPNYVPAIILLANLQYWELVSRQKFDPDEYDAMLERWAATARYAYEIDPTHPDAIQANAWVHFEIERDLQAAADGMAEAVALAPSNDETLRIASAFARQIGKFDASIRLAKRWSSIDPFCRVCDRPWRTALRLYEAGRFDESLELYATVDPESAFAYTSASMTSAEIYLLRGDPQTALDFLDRDFERYEDFRLEVENVRAIALWQLGRREEAVALREAHEAIADTRRLPIIAREYAWMGDKDRAFEILYDLYWPHMYRFRNVVQDPMWKPLVDDPRWRALLEQSGYTPEALAQIRFDPQLPD